MDNKNILIFSNMIGTKCKLNMVPSSAKNPGIKLGKKIYECFFLFFFYMLQDNLALHLGKCISAVDYRVDNHICRELSISEKLFSSY